MISFDQLTLDVPPNTRSIDVTFNVESEHDVEREAHVLGVEPYYLPVEGRGARWFACSHQSAERRVLVISPVTR